MFYERKARVRHPAINDMECYGLKRYNARFAHFLGTAATELANKQGQILPLELGTVHYFQEKKHVAELGESIIVRGGQEFVARPDSSVREARILGSTDLFADNSGLLRKLGIFEPLGGSALTGTGIKVEFTDTEEEQEFMPFLLEVTEPNKAASSYRGQGLALITADELLKAGDVDDSYIRRLSSDFIDSDDRRYGFDYGKHGKLERHRLQERAEAEAIEKANVYVTGADGTRWIQYSAASGLSYSGPDDLVGYYDI